MDAHMQALREEHFSTTSAQVRSFVGIFDVFRRLVFNFGGMEAPWTDLMKSTGPVLVPPATPLQQLAVEWLMDALTAPPVLATRRRGREYVLDVDACGTQVGLALLQDEENGKFQPLESISRLLAQEELPHGVPEIS